MMRSLWSAVSGLNTHQMEMDVIGNNISNVNTTAFKASSTGFQDVLYQTMKTSGAAGNNIASTNASQVGLGAKMGSIAVNITKQGSAVMTNNVMDLMITGPSFFIISPDNTTQNYSRDGSFTIDAQGNLVTQNNGYFVMGVMGEGGVPDDAATTKLKVIDNSTEVITGYYTDDTGKKKPITKLADVLEGTATEAAYMKGNLDSYDPSLAEGINVMLEVYGTDGNTYSLKFQLDDNGDDEDNTFRLSLKSVSSETIEIVNEEGEYEEIELPTNLSMDPILLEFDKHNGRLQKLVSNGTTINYTYELGKMKASQDFVPSFTGDVPIGNLNLDLMNMTNYAGTNGKHSSSINAYKGDTEGLNMGYPDGELTGISFGVDGSIYGRYSNGQTIKKAQIAVAEFSNAMGLEQVGNNLYAQSLNSGAAMVRDITKDGGYMNSGYLEGSNTDLAKEFTEMITTQRGFQANSRVITTSDEILQTLKNLKR